MPSWGDGAVVMSLEPPVCNKDDDGDSVGDRQPRCSCWRTHGYQKEDHDPEDCPFRGDRDVTSRSKSLPRSRRFRHRAQSRSQERYRGADYATWDLYGPIPYLTDRRDYGRRTDSRHWHDHHHHHHHHHSPEHYDTYPSRSRRYSPDDRYRRTFEDREVSDTLGGMQLSDNLNHRINAPIARPHEHFRVYFLKDGRDGALDLHTIEWLRRIYRESYWEDTVDGRRCCLNCTSAEGLGLERSHRFERHAHHDPSPTVRFPPWL